MYVHSDTCTLGKRNMEIENFVFYHLLQAKNRSKSTQFNILACYFNRIVSGSIFIPILVSSENFVHIFSRMKVFAIFIGMKQYASSVQFSLDVKAPLLFFMNFIFFYFSFDTFFPRHTVP